MNKKNKQPKTVILRACQYHYPNCQKTATYQHILKLGSVTIDKSWACQNCKQIIQKERK